MESYISSYFCSGMAFANNYYSYESRKSWTFLLLTTTLIKTNTFPPASHPISPHIYHKHRQ